MVEPKRWAVGLMVGCFGVDSGLSLQVIWGTTRDKKNPWREFRHGWTIGSVGIDEMALFAEKMLSVGQKMQDSTSAGLRQKAFSGLWLLKGTVPAMSQP